jgi:GH35 family endo-1,4-beta-xylanase
MSVSRREFLRDVAAMAGAGMYMPSLWAAMKYDRKAVLDLFHVRAADTDARVKAGIEMNRKGPMLFTFKDKAGKIYENVHLKVTQKAHDFRYGADLFMLDEMPSAELNAAYKARFAEAFNLATCPFYWTGLEPEQGKTRYEANAPKLYRRPPPDLCIEWCEKNGIEPKAHILNYASVTPEWAIGDIAKEKRLLVKRFRELSERYANRVRMWEVTNETMWGADYAGKNAANLYRQEDLVEWSFKTAEQFFPGNELIINEAHCRVWNDIWYQRERSPYYMQIERAIHKGARIDAVGLQFHMFHRAEKVVEATRDFYDPKRLFDVLDTYAKFNKPLQITEITIPAYSNDPGDEEVQAEILRELYRIWFSARGMEAIIYWNLPDGYAAFAEPGDFSSGENAYYGGLCRFDMSPKPAYQVVKDLFAKEWRTNFERDVGGRFAFRGFHGTYELEVTVNGKTQKQEFAIRPNFKDRIEIVV